MGNLNLHDVVRGAIESVNEDVDGIIYVSTGYTNTRGILTPTFTPVPVRLQIQAATHDKLYHERGLNYTVDLTTVYAYGNFSDLERPDGQGGDIVWANNMWGAVTQVNEWWPAWCCLDVTRQVNATTLQALLEQLANGRPFGATA